MNSTFDACGGVVCIDKSLGEAAGVIGFLALFVAVILFWLIQRFSKLYHLICTTGTRFVVLIILWGICGIIEMFMIIREKAPLRCNTEPKERGDSAVFIFSSLSGKLPAKSCMRTTDIKYFSGLVFG